MCVKITGSCCILISSYVAHTLTNEKTYKNSISFVSIGNFDWYKMVYVL